MADRAPVGRVETTVCLRHRGKERGAADYYPDRGPATAHARRFAGRLPIGSPPAAVSCVRKMSRFSVEANAWSDQVQIVDAVILRSLLCGDNAVLSPVPVLRFIRQPLPRRRPSIPDEHSGTPVSTGTASHFLSGSDRWALSRFLTSSSDAATSSKRWASCS